jgi:Putative sensor
MTTPSPPPDPSATDPPESDPVIPRHTFRLLLSRYPWASAGYLLGYLPVGTALFVASATVVAVAAGLCVTLAGLPLLAGAAVLVRGYAEVERQRLRTLLPGGVVPPYRKVTGRGVLAQLRERWTDPATRRDLTYLVVLYPPLMIIDTLVLTIWLTLLGLVGSPLWYWSIPNYGSGSLAHGISLGYFPHGPHGPGGWGVFVGDPGTALATAAVALVLFLAANHLLVATAFTHARIARALLRPYRDPMSEAKRILATPGPLAR